MKSPSGNFWLRFYSIIDRSKNRFFTILVKSSFREFGSGSTLQRPVGIWGASSISIGKKVHIGSGSWLHFLNSKDLGQELGIHIGDGCSFAGGVVITSVKSVQIGDFVLFGKNVHIADHGHEYHNSNIPIIQQGISEALPVVVGSGSWIGQGVIICPGVTIGKNCVIGANSVVKSNIPDFSVAVGAPAKVVRKIEN